METREVWTLLLHQPDSGPGFLPLIRDLAYPRASSCSDVSGETKILEFDPEPKSPGWRADEQ